jgi:uncharacterized protein (TIGR02145 family)
MKFLTIIVLCFLFNSCVKETVKTTTKKGIIPTVKTIDATEIFSTQASSGGIITSEGSSTIIDKGICWSTSPSPTISSTKASSGAGASSFTSLMMNLSPATTYYYRAYATNSVGTAYGMTLKFGTLQGSFINGKGVTDVDGNSYPTVRIGSALNSYQEWMAEDLRTTKFNDGSPIKNELNDSLWQFSGMAAYRYYNNDEANISKLYNFYTVSNGNVCPSGWHVPTTSDWNILFSKLGPNSNTPGKYMKLPGTSFWEQSGGINSSGFSAKGNGLINLNGGFEKIKTDGYWWTGNSHNNLQGVAYTLKSNSESITLILPYKQSGMAIRCIKNN